MKYKIVHEFLHKNPTYKGGEHLEHAMTKKEALIRFLERIYHKVDPDSSFYLRVKIINEK